jgi:beta-glucanase (GH16 family)
MPACLSFSKTNNSLSILNFCRLRSLPTLQLTFSLRDMAPSRTLLALTALSTLLQSSFAQTWTSCNPLNATCANDPALGTNYTWHFDQASGDPKIWNATNGDGLTYNDGGAQFQINSEGMSPTMQSTFYIMFGMVTVQMQAASGTGIISSIVLESDDLDEVDWEFMGGNTTHVETNYFGKGNITSYDRAIYYPLPDGSSPQVGWHNYTTNWTAEKIDWLIDGVLVRTLHYGEANGGQNFPQTPMTVRLGSWAGGDPKKNPIDTVQWAGGETDFAKGPFNMYVKSIFVQDYSTGAEYVYTDRSGSFQSIKSTNGTSAAVKQMSRPHGVKGHWRALPAGVRAAIVIASIAGLALLVLSCLGFCFWQGRKGRKEKAVADAQWEKEQAEFNQYRMQMMKGGFSASATGPRQV